MIINFQEIKSLDDFEYLRTLRNKTYIRINSLNKKKVSKKDHKNWLDKNKKNKIFILKDKKKNIGYIRIDEKKFVSWALEKKYWGKIKFADYLKKTINNKKFTYFCEIIRNNIRSQIVALKAGFQFDKSKENIIRFKKN
tara:strand:- start:22 stop:438 length:417 start_codon:yes stop_codon:yes gene_type:complete